MLNELPIRLKALAAQGVWIGTSSWKYPEWGDIIYSLWCYETKAGRFSERMFKEGCLEEYGRTFRTVCADSSFYTFPTAESLAPLVRRMPDDFLMAFKVTEAISVKHFPRHARYGDRAGTKNPDFLNADLFASQFLAPLEPMRANVGPLIFQFPAFRKADFAHGRDFVAALDAFLAQLPAGWRYAVELRNPTFLHLDYFAMLRSRGVAHCFNSWEKMPSVHEQLAMEGSITADFTVARFLTLPGRGYEATASAFKPYNSIKQPDPETRGAIVETIRAGLKLPGGAFIYINNRLEGCAPLTIAAVLRIT